MTLPSKRRFDVATQQLASTYARAFVGAAETSNSLSASVAELDSLVKDVVRKSPQLQEVFASEFVNTDQKELLVDRVFGQRASAGIVNFLKVLARHGRLRLLSSIRDEVEKQNHEKLGQVEVEVVTALPLQAAGRQELTDLLRKMLGAEPLLYEEVDPQLLGGVTVRIGDRVYDGSVATQLKQLRSQMIERTMEKIETSRGQL